MTTPVFEIADRYVDAYGALDPIGASYAGLPGHDHEMTDLSPEGHERRAELDRRTLAELRDVEVTDDADRRGRAVMLERLGVALEAHEDHEWSRDLNTIASSLQSLVEVLDLADVSTAPGREQLRSRLGALPEAIEGYRRSLEVGLDHEDPVARRQVVAAIAQTRARMRYLVETGDAVVAAGGRSDTGDLARRAARAYGDLGEWLEAEYLPRARVGDGVGIERYRRAQRMFLGADPDPAESYAWGWHEVRSIAAEMRRVADRIRPGASVAEALHFVEHDSPYAAIGLEAFVRWAQDHVDSTIETLGDSQFVISEAMRRVEVRASPPGGSTAPHYTGPTADGSRPGIYWQPDLGRDRYPLWNQVTTAHHEAVPGHHLQIAQVVLGGAKMTRFQRHLCWISGHGEGWALYAERLGHELGLLERPEAELGFWAAAQLRAVRVVIDIGVHCGFDLPSDAPLHGGEAWSWEVAFDLARTLTGESDQEMTSEIDRYFGWPGQAPSYKLGEREWLAARDQARAVAGEDFDLARFHAVALDLGSVGLDVLRDEVVGAFTRSGNRPDGIRSPD